MNRGTRAGDRTHRAFLRPVSVKKKKKTVQLFCNPLLFRLSGDMVRKRYVLLEVLIGFSSMLTQQRRSKNVYFGEVNLLLRFTFSSSNHRIFPFDCLVANIRYDSFDFCHRTEFQSTRHCPLLLQFVHCINVPAAVRYKMHLRYSCR
jgi:hypothetical protein